MATNLDKSDSSPGIDAGCFTIDGFCRWSGLGRTKVYEIIAERGLNPLKCGRRTLITAEDARRWRDALPSFH